MTQPNHAEKQHILTDVNEQRGTASSRSTSGDEQTTKKRGLTVMSATTLVVGEMAGSGILALPFAVEKTGYMGILLILIIGSAGAFTGTLLGRCWVMVQTRHEEYRGHVRRPYPIIGQAAFGNWARSLVSFFMDLSIFGAGVVFLILASQNIQDLLLNLFNIRISFCYLLLVVTAAMLPFTWLGTPNDFWIMGVGATSASAVACFILVYVEIQDSLGPFKDVPVHHSKIEPLSFFQGVGIMCYAYGGHTGFPTIQNDMLEPSRFGIVSGLAFHVCALMYIIMAAPAYFIYGDKLEPNVTLTMSPGPILYLIQILITGHIFCAFIIVINPLAQELEDFINVKKKFSWTRIATRTSLVAAMLFVAETVPKFGAVLSLIGGSAMISTSVFFPCVFYLRLRATSEEYPREPIPLHLKVAVAEIILVGIIIMTFATFGSLHTMIAPDTFTWPCYVDITSADESSRS